MLEETSWLTFGFLKLINEDVPLANLWWAQYPLATLSALEPSQSSGLSPLKLPMFSASARQIRPIFGGLDLDLPCQAALERHDAEEHRDSQLAEENKELEAALKVDPWISLDIRGDFGGFQHVSTASSSNSRV